MAVQENIWHKRAVCLPAPLSRNSYITGRGIKMQIVAQTLPVLLPSCPPPPPWILNKSEHL
jgi:hypothetical protein